MAENNNRDIPYDLLPSILQHLPSKTLLQYLTVSKSWYSLIKSPSFITLHREKQHKSNNNNNNNIRLFLLKSRKSYRLFRYGDPSVKRRRRRLRLESPPDGFNTILASSNTLICLSSNEDVDNIVVWNPCINRYKKVALSQNLENVTYTLGLADDSEDGPKIVMIYYPWNRSMISYNLSTSFLAKVYCVNNPSVGWKQVPLSAALATAMSADDIVSCMSLGSCAVNGFIHWIVFGLAEVNVGDDIDLEVRQWHGKAFILTFDTKKDCFAIMQLPKTLKQRLALELSLAVFNDSLVVVDHRYMSSTLNVWRMEEYGSEDSWKLSYRVELSPATKSKVWEEEEDKVFITTSLGMLIGFNLKSCNSHGVHEGHLGKPGSQAFGFTQSLLLLD